MSGVRALVQPPDMCVRERRICPRHFIAHFILHIIYYVLTLSIVKQTAILCHMGAKLISHVGKLIYAPFLFNVALILKFIKAK